MNSNTMKILILLWIGMGILYLIVRDGPWAIVVGLILIVTAISGIVIARETMKKDPNDQREYEMGGFGNKDEREPMDDIKDELGGYASEKDCEKKELD